MNQQPKSKHSKNSGDIEQNNSSSLVEPQKLLGQNLHSPNMQKVQSNHLNHYDYEDKNYHNAKTIEQVNLRIVRQSSSNNANNMLNKEMASGGVAGG